MSSITENRPPQAALPEPTRSEERYVDEQIRRTRRALKLVDLTAGLLTLLIGTLVYLLVMALLEHWVVPGGWSPTARGMLWIVLVGGVAWYSWRLFWPLLSKPINPAYAAQTIEKSSPSLKNSLLNLLLLRDRRRQISKQVYQAIERQAAQRLSEVPLDSVVDRGAIIFLGRILAAIVALAALYLWLSPKDPITSVGRLLMPWSELAVPSRVQIVEVQPGDTSAARGEQLLVSAEITGVVEDEPARLRYSQADGQIVDQEVLMSPQDDGVHYESRLPGLTAPGGGGIQSDLVYWIEAGDARSKRYEVSVFAQPTLVVDRVRYEYPSYTGYGSREVENTGDLSAVEGTVVTISAISNQQIKTAHVDFEADGRHDLLMKSEGCRATVSFPLELREDRHTPRYQSYVLRYTTDEGRKNSSPPKYRIDVERDYAPEVELLEPTEEMLDVNLHDEVVIAAEARDPDYAVHNVAILGEVGGEKILKESLLSQDHTGKFVGQMKLVPADLGLNVGDVLEYWAAAADNRRPEPNLAFTEHQKIRVIGPGDQGGQQGQQQGEGESEGGRQGQQDQGGEDGQQGQEGGQAGGAGGENQQANPGEQQGGEGGVGQEGEAPGENSEQQPGDSGESTEGDQQSNGDSDGSAGGNSPSDGEKQSPNQENTGPGEGASGGEPSEGQQKVSPEGDDDGTAFERIAKHFEEKEGDADGAEGKSGESGEEASDAQGSAGSQNNNHGAADESDATRQGETDDSKETGRENSAEGSEGKRSQPQEPGEQQQQEDSAAPDGEMTENQGPAGAGENPGENQGAPSPSGEQKPNEKPTEDATGNRQDDQEAPSESQSKNESDSQGSQGGDRSGGGQEGAGQQADADGKGGAGEHQAADDGSGQAGEPGADEAAAQPGEDEQAAGETGESSGDQPGQGGEQSDESGSQPGGEQTPSADQPSGDNQSESDSSSGGLPQAGGTGGSSSSPPPSGETEPGDEANLEYARRQTDLVIDKLDEQLRKQEVDEELLEELGWTTDELRRFVERWRNLKSQAEGTGPQAEEARQELNESLKSLGLRRDRQAGFQTQSAKDKLRDLQDAYRGRTPLEYQELMRKYIKGTATVKENNE